MKIEPYFETDLGKIYRGDCLELMRTFADNLVDLTVTSPPYDNLRTYHGSLEWGEHIWKPILKELYRVTKKGGVVAWVVGDATIKGSETGTSFKQALFAMDCGFNLHDTMIYQSAKPPLTHNRYEQNFEYMFVFSKNKPKTFNPIMVNCKYYGESLKAKTMRRLSDDTSSISGKNKRVKEFKIKNNIWVYNTGAGHSTLDREAFRHPAIFPEKLAHDNILSWSDEDDTVFDPMMGSGTTLKMACQSKRRFIGIETREEYCEIAKHRIRTYLKGFK